MTQTEALKQALEALEDYKYAEARTIIREALAQPEQEPVAEYIGFTDYAQTEDDARGFGKIKRLKFIPLNARLYTVPPQRTWIGLTDDEQQRIYDIWIRKGDGWGLFYELIEAKLRELNQ